MCLYETYSKRIAKGSSENNRNDKRRKLGILRKKKNTTRKNLDECIDSPFSLVSSKFCLKIKAKNSKTLMWFQVYVEEIFKTLIN
jgi:hypothetical protein